jgi:uncharacterized membrane protein YjgN (DUF898 family)
MRKTAMILISVLLIVICSLGLFKPAIADTQDDYFDNMITLKVGRYLKLEFYEVKSDFDGGIYLDINDFLVMTELSQYSQLTTEGENICLTIQK